MNTDSAFCLHDWRIEPNRNRVVGPHGDVHLTPRTMAVLVCLAEHAGEVVSRNQFSEQVWAQAVVTDDALTRCISELRRVFGDRSASPRFIETIPKSGYRLVAPVKPVNAPAETDPSSPSVERTGKPALYRTLGMTIAAIIVAAAVWWLWNGEETPGVAIDSQSSIAVMPFRTIGAEPTVPLAEGMHFDLLSRLSAFPALRVIASSAVARYRGEDWTADQVARDLDVDWILDGSVQQHGERVQVNAQLIDAGSGSNRWARTYRRDLSAGDLFALQGEVIEDIAQSLAGQLDSRLQSDPNRAPTQNLEAYTLFTQARTMLARRSAVDMWRAVELLEAAIELDPDYALAMASLADAFLLLAYYGHGDRDELISQARLHANRALEIDPQSARSHVVIGVARLIDERDGPGALQALQTAHALDSAFSGWLGWAQAVTGDLAPAIENVDAMFRIVPTAPGAEWTMAKLKFCAGDLDNALRLASSARDRSPAYARAHLLEGQIRLAKDQPALAIEAIESALSHLRAEPDIEYSTWLAIARLRAGEPVDLPALQDRLAADQATFEQGLLHWAQGNFEAAFDAFMLSDLTDIQTVHVRYNPILAELRTHPRYTELLNDLEMSWQLNADDPPGSG